MRTRAREINEEEIATLSLLFKGSFSTLVAQEGDTSFICATSVLRKCTDHGHHLDESVKRLDKWLIS